jgi:membrane protease YdiL (CAAX protease family)
MKESIQMKSNDLQQQLPFDYIILYIILLFALSIPLWWLGGNRLPIPVELPVSSFIVVCPLIAASMLTYKQSGICGVKKLLKKAFDYKKIKNPLWYVPILLLNPLIMLLSYGVMRLTGLPLPNPQIPWLMAPIFFGLFFIFAMGEEVGWMGYAIDPMQKRWGALQASVVLGFVWVAWHLIGDLQVGNAANWILWHRIASVANRILIVWLYNNTGKSVFGAILYHDMLNVSWALFPNYGSHYDPFVTGVITLLAAAIVIVGWGPKTLSSYRFAGTSRS